MAIITKTNTFTAGTSAVASQVNTNFDTIYNEFNGNISNANLIASAAIVDTKLATIATAGKVSGASLSLLGSIPSSAGILPSVNTRKTVIIKGANDIDAPVTGDGAAYLTCPTELNGMNLVAVGASVLTASTSGTPTVQISRGRRSAANGALTYVDMLSTRITIDENEYDSANATAAAVINETNDDIVVSTYVDVLRVDIDVAGTGTIGLEVRLSFQAA